ncbi:asparagine synthase (glutamine-hydrolyzing) [Saccharopolyspora indica]|uniref:asparagine synthase (glutamine-hydrolyzing) n=1 Tax=Saccharopolyspora indica TaxID=1229659 RepID=UPI0022EBA319|nr:asparagine synthase (glutamine-hydrolyzing) [Saccharopolyspora indica]MDA3647680.1 asparagine synthase (glutamine-hydrolyzing) [Saccharopolyspora indica]
MCGIAGWVDFERNLGFERSTVRSMVATLANRGPDGEDVWASTSAVLGHRRLAVIDVPGGKQPMLAEHDDRTLAVLVYNGEIYNFRELRAELDRRGHSFRTASDTEVLLNAYLEWGAGCVERLEGMFAFAVWDERNRELVLGRDRMGIKPLFYAPLGSGVLFGSEAKAVLAHPEVEAVVDAEGLAELLGFVGTPGHAIYRGMREVAPGHVVRVRASGITERRYWSLPVREHTEDRESTLRTVRELLTDSVVSHLVSDVPLCTLLSGGVDSSAIVAIAARAMRDDRPRSFSVDFAGHAERFEADKWHRSADAPFAAQVAEHVGTDHEPVVLSTHDVVDPVTRAAALRAQDVPRPLGDMDRSLYLLSRAVREKSTVALCGEVADEVFGGYNWYHDPSIVGSGTFPWIAVGQRYASPQGLGTGLLDPALLKQLDVPGYCADRYREAIAEIPVLDGESATERTMREVAYVHLTRWMQILLSRDDRLSAAVGLELRVPFADHELVEYAFNVPWSMKTVDGTEKALLRDAVRDLLPEQVLTRKKSPFPTTQDPAYGQALREQFTAVLDDPASPVRELVDTGAVDELLAGDAPIPIDGWRDRNNVDMVLQLDSWLRHYRVRLAL